MNTNYCDIFYSKDEGYVLKSHFKDLKILDQTLDQYIWKDMHKWKDSIAIECTETNRTYTYSELKTYSQNFAKNLYEMSRLIDICKPKLIIGVPECLPNISKSCLIKEINVKYISVKIGNKHDTHPADNFFNLIHEKSNSYNTTLNIHRTPNDACAILFSSGTTGPSKGAVLTHTNLISSANIFNSLHRTRNSALINQQDAWLCYIPFFHIGGLNIGLIPKLAIGCKLITIPTFNSQSFISAIIHYRPPALLTVPPIFSLLTENKTLSKKHWDCVKIIYCGSAILNDSLKMKFMNRHPKIKCLQCYGLTEAAGVVVISSANTENCSSIGTIEANMELKIAKLGDPNFTGLNMEEIGEILVRGPSVMKKYYENIQATKETITSNGWLRTGDIGYFNDNGLIYLNGRLKELIKVKGYQVAPVELEELLCEHPAVLSAAVVGVPDSRKGEIPRAYVILKEDIYVTEMELQDYVNGRVSEYKRLLGGVCFVESFPKTELGKVVRYKLKNFN